MLITNVPIKRRILKQKEAPTETFMVHNVVKNDYVDILDQQDLLSVETIKLNHKIEEIKKNISKQEDKFNKQQDIINNIANSVSDMQKSFSENIQNTNTEIEQIIQKLNIENKLAKPIKFLLSKAKLIIFQIYEI